MIIRLFIILNFFLSLNEFQTTFKSRIGPGFQAVIPELLNIKQKQELKKVYDYEQSLADPKVKIHQNPSRDIAYEVKCDETWAYYEGYITEYNHKTKSLHIAYRPCWRQNRVVSLKDVRPKSKLNLFSNGTTKPNVDEEIEVLAKADEDEPYGWFPAKLKMIQDENYLITYDGWSDHLDLMALDMIRPRSKENHIQSWSIQFLIRCLKWTENLKESINFDECIFHKFYVINELTIVGTADVIINKIKTIEDVWNDNIWNLLNGYLRSNGVLDKYPIDVARFIQRFIRAIDTVDNLQSMETVYDQYNEYELQHSEIEIWDAKNYDTRNAVVEADGMNQLW